MIYPKISSLLVFGLLLVCNLKPAPLLGQIKPMGQKGTTRAVVIGVSDYQNEHIPDLLFAHADALAFANYLKSPAGGGLPEENVKVLTNKQATQGQMAAVLTWLLEESKEGDQAIVYFSGHGDMETQTMANYGFLLTHDAPASTYMAGGAFPVVYLQSIIQTLSAQKGVQVMMIADACHSGKLAGSAGGGTQATAKVLADQFANEAKILSCQPNEFSIEGPEWGGGHGVFTYYLIDGLTGFADANGDFTVTLLEIQRFLEDQVSAAAAPRSQIPLVFGNKSLVTAKVDPPTFAALKAKRLNEPSGDLMGFVGARSVSGPGAEDSLTMALYRRFLAALETKHLLYPEEGSAYSIYNTIRDRPLMQDHRQEMRRNLAAALQDAAQQAINDYLAASPVELRKRWSFDPEYEHFPEYLGKAAEILGPDHFMYKGLKSKELYFEGLNLRLKGERERDVAFYQQADQLQRQVLQIDSSAAYALNELGLLSRRKGDFAGSIHFFQKALAFSPTWVLAETNLCGSLKDLGQTREAVEACRKALQNDSTFALAYHNLGVALADQKEERKKAIFAFQKALEFDSGYAMTYFKLGEAFYFENQLEQAESMWKKSARLAPGDVLSFYNLGVLSADQGEKQEALQYFRKVTELAPDDPDAYLDIVELQTAMDRLEEAENVLKTVFKLAPGLPDGDYLLAGLLARQNEEDDALDALQSALEKGFRDRERILRDPALANIRQTARFKDLMKKHFPD